MPESSKSNAYSTSNDGGIWTLSSIKTPDLLQKWIRNRIVGTIPKRGTILCKIIFTCFRTNNVF